MARETFKTSCDVEIITVIQCICMYSSPDMRMANSKSTRLEGRVDYMGENKCIQSFGRKTTWKKNTKNYAYEQTKLRGLSPQANYTDRATAACSRS
jgi:hypothetical protein